MKPSLLRTPQAREDLLEIYVTIGLESPSAAERLYNAIEEKVTLLVNYPRLGVRRPEMILEAARGGIQLLIAVATMDRPA